MKNLPEKYVANSHSPFTFQIRLLKGESPFFKDEWAFERTNSALKKVKTFTHEGVIHPSEGGMNKKNE
jgi:hypothetical protein